MLLDRLCEHANVPTVLRQQVRGGQVLAREPLDAFVDAFRRAEPDVGRECRNALRALAMLGSADHATTDLAEAWLTGADEEDAADRVRWGLPADNESAESVAVQISRLLACTGPALLAVDQIDTIFAQARTSVIDDVSGQVSATIEPLALAENLGHGLMDLREKLLRTVTVVACLPTSWALIRDQTSAPVPQRFRQETRLSRLPSADVGAALVAARFGPFFEAAGFDPPYPTWPLLSEAFVAAPDFTPRSLLQRADEHVRVCLDRDEVIPLADLREPVPIGPETPPPSPEQATEFTSRFEQLRAEATIEQALSPATEDREMSRLLGAGLRALAIERGDPADRYRVLVGEGGNPSMHAWFSEILDDDTEDEAHWYFRAVSHTHARAVQARLERLRSLAQPTPGISKRRAILLRQPEWPNGPVSQRVKREFLNAGGVMTKVSADDLRTYAALDVLLREQDPALPGWLTTAHPAGRSSLFREVFGSAGTDQTPGSATGIGPKPMPAVGRAPVEVVASADHLVLGTVAENGRIVPLPLAALRKHTAIFAGSGSGKTVLIRRLIEQCALRGISTIVLDPNNDLARLGDSWPEPPASWLPGDAEDADRYLAGTDVVVWTPRRESGRPLSLQPLPDFGAVLSEPDEFALALDSSVAALAPRARMDAGTAKADRGRAVLRVALEHFARGGGQALPDFIDLLANLPDEAAALGRARDLAADMAETLRAAMINDPLFGGVGTPLDPGELLRPEPGRRARVSVISLIGLPNLEQRRSFVNQLQMALFAWIKRNPAGDRPLGGLFVMDEAQNFAPSGQATVCTESTLALASQARKYGLGLVFATQAPKGIHNRIVGNAATQFYGFLNSPTQIAAAKEVAQAKGSAVLEISRLKAGQFYAVSEGMSFRRLDTPMCLSHHPESALTEDEVLLRAKG
ncbi:hypothetical protein FB565_007903 [Actinoplanes lutulentus]|uniref:ATP-binding protein n=1 Tax=Actinoplanes lutulentus TaxID=1287878 RepID=UPI001834D613|nr:ATP-binding protein [Actinoplanes lutulentus]MBB2948132.1 hypothetical protein [Actinoplanes lutulentus]